MDSFKVLKGLVCVVFQMNLEEGGATALVFTSATYTRPIFRLAIFCELYTGI